MFNDGGKSATASAGAVPFQPDLEIRELQTISV